MRRRTVLKLSLATGVAVALGAAAITAIQSPRADGRLRPPGREMFAAVARAVLGPLLPSDPARAKTAIDEHLSRLEAAIAGMPSAVQAEIDELTAIASSTPGRVALIGLTTPWAEASAAAVEAAMQALRFSSMGLRQQIYQALRELTNAAYFADPSTFAQLGYPGQRPVPNRPAA